MRVEKAETVGIGLKMSDGKNVHDNDVIANIRQQVTDMFYGEIRQFLNIVGQERSKFNMKHPSAKALCAVMDADAVGKISDHIEFDGCTVTNLSEEGNIVMMLYVDFKQKFDPESVRDEAEDEVDKD